MSSHGHSSPKSTAAARKRLRILCADDDHHVAMMIELALKHFGHEVTLVGDGHAALALVTEGKGPFDLVITDNDMPVMSGLRLVEGLRNHGYSGKIAVHSSELRPATLAAYQAQSVDKIFQKPVPLPAFVKAIHQLGGVET